MPKGLPVHVLAARAVHDRMIRYFGETRAPVPSQNALARMLGFDPGSYSRAMTGTDRGSLDWVHRVLVRWHTRGYPPIVLTLQHNHASATIPSMEVSDVQVSP